MPDPTRQRAFALEIVQKLRAAGFESLWAGGCVRDQLLGLVPKDFDVATSATPDQIRDVFGHRRTIPIGAAFGVITVLGPRGAGQIEVATFRRDSTYSDGRHPDSVTFTDARHDAQRRDFTINGLFFDPVAEEVVDYVGGQDDLKRRTIRAIGDPRLRLREDKLRMLRAVRFAATFGFEIEPETFCAIKEMAADISSVSAERIGMEIRRMLVDPNRADALRLLRECNLQHQVLPEIADLSSSDFDDILSVLQVLHEPSLPLALAVLLIHVPRTVGTEYGVPSTEAKRAGTDDSSQPAIPRQHAPVHAVGRRLRFTNKEIERAAWLLANRAMILSASQAAWPRLQRVLTHDGAGELLALHEAIAGPADDELAFCRERLAWPPERLNPAPLVTGADLIALGLTPGPQFAELLERIRDAQLNGEIHTRDEALALIDGLR
jgi:tRNA nucleotidyltransferase/poly(A) polymerase